ncbi:MAG: hypothetical protein ACTSYD_07355 [Candidatus Heimdallarchaeaceae archaeon]
MQRKLLFWSLIGLLLSSVAIGLIISYSLAGNNAFDINPTNDLEGAPQTSDFDTGANSSPDLTEEQVTDILLANEEVQSFLSYFSNVELYLDYDAFSDSWYATYISLDDYMSYIFAIVDDTSAEIIYIETFYAITNTTLTEDEVLQIALGNEIVQSFIANHTEYEYYIYFDYYQFWYVDFYASYSYDWCSVIIDDVTGDIVDVYCSDNLYNTILTEDEVYQIALTDPDVQQFISNHPDYLYYIYLSECFDTFSNDQEGGWGFSENLTWIVEFYTPDYSEWIDVWIDDSTAQIIDKWMSLPATLTNDEVLAIAGNLTEIQSFYAQYNDVVVDIWYDGTGYWNLYYYSETFLDAYAYVVIEDLSGEVVYVESYIPTPAQHTEDEVLSVILSLDEITEFMATYPDATYYLYCFDGLWYFDIYSDAYQGGIFVTVDDASLSVISIEYYNYTEIEIPI